MTLHLTDSAEADLAEIWGYIATEVGETTATRYLDRITKTIEVARQSPLIGTIRDQLSAGLRGDVSPSLRHLLPSDQANTYRCPGSSWCAGCSRHR